MPNRTVSLKPKQFYNMASINRKRESKDTSVKMVVPAKKRRMNEKNGMKENKTDIIDNDQGEREDDGISEYQKMINKNIEEKMAFFAALDFDGIKEDIRSLSARKKKPRVYRKKEPLPLRPKSLRLQKMAAEEIQIPDVLKDSLENEPQQLPHKPLLFTEIFNEENISSSDLFTEGMQQLIDEKEKFLSEPLPYSRYEEDFKSMTINSSLVAKVTTARVCSLAIHPMTSKTLICAGGKSGDVGFWEVESKSKDDGVYRYQPHCWNVYGLAFNISNPFQVISSSYDGTVRCGDIEKAVFDEVYCIDEYGIRCHGFDFLTPYSILVGQSDGNVSVVDFRTPESKAEILHATHPCAVKTVSVHPSKKDFFIASGSNGIVSLWDIRKVKKSPMAELKHDRSVNSAYFSPISGDFILTTSLDDSLRIFDSSHLEENIKVKTTLRHNNFTGRWLTPFRAVWLPENEDAFIVGSNKKPRQVEVFNISGTLVHKFIGEDLGSICSINALHPTKRILAGGSSSGKVHIFKGKS